MSWPKAFFVSDVNTVPVSDHRLIVAIRHDSKDGDFIILRSALDRRILQDLITQIESDPGNDAFLINTAGLLQTSSRRYGDPLREMPLPVPYPANGTRVLGTVTSQVSPFWWATPIFLTVPSS